MITFAQFVIDYPEFANATQAQFMLCQNRAAMHITGNWGQPSTGSDPSQYTQNDIGTELVIAHFLARAALRAIAVAKGGPAMGRGVISSESAGSVSVNYDTTASTEEGAGHWNETDYGREYVQMARLIGAAPSMATPGGQPNASINGPAWSGNWQQPGGFY